MLQQFQMDGVSSVNSCEDCEIYTNESTCPICHQLLSDTNIKTEGRAYPVYNQRQYKLRAQISRMTVIGGIIAILICLLINMIVMPHFLWVFYVAVAVFYLVVSLNHTILSAAHLGGKITAQVVSLTVLLLVIDGMSGSVQWSVNYVVPFVIIAGILLISIIIIKVRLKWTGYVSFLLMMIALGFLPLILYFSGLANVLWPSISAASFSIATFLAMLLIGNASFMTQLGRRFHF